MEQPIPRLIWLFVAQPFTRHYYSITLLLPQNQLFHFSGVDTLLCSVPKNHISRTEFYSLFIHELEILIYFGALRLPTLYSHEIRNIFQIIKFWFLYV